jgi:uncharacterized protein (DUF2267 family)
VIARKGVFMRGGEFIAEVRNLAELDSSEEAERATRATLETLRERLAGNEPSNLAAQLPPEIAPYADGDGGGESFSVAEFYERVAEREKGWAATRLSATHGRWRRSCRRP